MRGRLLRLAAALLLAAPAVWQLALVVRLYAGRVAYVYDIEWLESATLYQGHRVAAGLPLYAPPWDGTIPLPQPPVHAYLLGALEHVFGPGYAAARTLSFAAFVGALALVALALRRRSWVLVALAAGCAAAGTPLIRGFYDLVRADATALFFAVAAAALAGGGVLATRRLALVALLLTATLYTRLPYLFIVAWIILWVFVQDRRAGAALVGWTAVFAAAVLAALQLASGGWFWMYVVAMPQHHPITRDALMFGWKMLIDHAPFLLAVPIVAAGLASRRRLSRQALLWSGLVVAAFPAALLPFVKRGGFQNDLMPVVFFAGPAASFLISDFGERLRWTLGAALSLYLVARAWSPAAWIPPVAQAAQARKLRAEVAALDGSVFAPHHPYLPVLAGKTNVQVMDMGYWDARLARWPAALVDLGSVLDRESIRWALVSGREIPETALELARRYRVERRLAAPQMLTGVQSVLTWVMRRQEPEPPGTRVLYDFETDEGWTATGDAFALGPTTARPKKQAAIVGVVGERCANSFRPDMRDAATGRLVSPPFTLDRRRLSLRVGGGWRDGTRVELRAGGKLLAVMIPPFEATEVLVEIVVDVRAHQGKEAQLTLIDEDKASWGHLVVDRIVLFD